MKLVIRTNEPETVQLISIAPERRESQFGGEQYLFLTDRGDLYVSEAVGDILLQAIAAQGIRSGEPVVIAKRATAAANGRQTIRWSITRAASAAPPEPPAPAAAVPPPPRPPAVERTAAAAPDAWPQWASVLLGQTNALTDVYAAALAHASAAHGNAVKPETIQSLLVTAFINLSKGASSRAA
jgi:hypothetical protein